MLRHGLCWKLPIHALAALLGLALFAGCAGDAPAGAPAPGLLPPPCPPGEVSLGGADCMEAGLPSDMPCPPGEAPLDEGGCRPAGIPPDECGDGFLPDVDGGCEAILPAEPCPPGMMAVPGETTCREIAPCGSGDVGDIPFDAATQFVNSAYAGPDPDGTQERPWPAIANGIQAAAPGAIVAVAAGVYQENLTIEKPVRLWGRCPDLVTISGTPGANVIHVHDDAASGAEIRALAVMGGERGIVVDGASAVLIDRVWIHDTALEGIAVSDTPAGASGAEVTGCVVEQAGYNGIHIAGAQATIEATVIRNGWGRQGLTAEVFGEERADVAVLRSLVEENDIGVYVRNSDMLVESTVIRDGLRGVHAYEVSRVVLRASILDRMSGDPAHANWSDLTLESMVIQDDPAAPPDYDRSGLGVNGAWVKVQRSVFRDTRGPGVELSSSFATVEGTRIERSLSAGVILLSSELTMDASVVRGSREDPDGLPGWGVLLGVEEIPAETAATIRTSLIEDNRGAGVMAQSAVLLLESTAVRGVTPSEADPGNAAGISLRPATPAWSTTAEVRGSVIERIAGTGIDVDGSDAVLDGVLVRDTITESVGGGAGDVHHGGGLDVHSSSVTGRPSNVTVIGSVLEQHLRYGVMIESSNLSLESTVIRDTRSDAGELGDGLIALASGAPAAVSLSWVRIESNERAGIANFGAVVDLAGTTLQCNGFDLAGQDYEGSPSVVHDLGGNACGCPEATGACAVLSADLEPPEAAPGAMD